MTFAEADAAYPFDPSARVEDLRGLEKLRAFSDRGMRASMYRLWENAARVEAEERRRPVAPAQAALNFDGRQEKS